MVVSSSWACVSCQFRNQITSLMRSTDLEAWMGQFLPLEMRDAWMQTGGGIHPKKVKVKVEKAAPNRDNNLLYNLNNLACERFS